MLTIFNKLKYSAWELNSDYDIESVASWPLDERSK